MNHVSYCETNFCVPVSKISAHRCRWGNAVRPGTFSDARTDGSQNRRRGMRRAGIALLHDNDRPHAALCRQQMLQRFRGSWEVSGNLTYNPDLAPRDYHLVKHLKRFLAGQHFPSDDNVQAAVTPWFC
ncbi:hypothetical protein AVEN_261223-1 [Araneus ventricosus]|uniref:Histone-lysine N-methyltransferase SETMAR n=1 Tax=Araneus ventricosus TaxID=182803 RepID=A0A4Y2GM93_ARAVE|nr:hypothetical protein AVEN_261223-1 [Araneus ventricosus]